METQLDMSSISILVACIAAAALLVTFVYGRMKNLQTEDKEQQKEVEASEVRNLLNKLESASDVSQSKSRKKMPPQGDSRD